MAGGMYCGRHAWQGACIVGEAYMAGGMHGRGACMVGGHVWQGGMHGRGHAWCGHVYGRRDGHCSRQYASYWNAFLFDIQLIGVSK